MKTYIITSILDDDVSNITNVDVLRKYIDLLRLEIKSSKLYISDAVKSYVNNKIDKLRNEILNNNENKEENILVEDVRLGDIDNNIFNDLKVKQITIKGYVSALNRLKKNDTLNKLFLIKDKEDIEKLVVKEFNKCPETYFKVIVNIIKISYPNNKEIYDFYLELMVKYKSKRECNSSKLTKKEKLNWVDLPIIIKKFEKLYNNKDQLKKKEIKDAVILGLYTLQPPRRNDYSSMKILYEGDDSIDKKYNYYDIKNKEFIFNVYKTDKTYKQQIIKIEDDRLIELLDILLKDKPEFLLNRSYDSKAFNKILTRLSKKHFNKTIGSSLYRKIYNTHNFSEIKDLAEKRKNIATKMGHSIETQDIFYVKVEEKHPQHLT